MKLQSIESKLHEIYNCLVKINIDKEKFGLLDGRDSTILFLYNYHKFFPNPSNEVYCDKLTSETFNLLNTKLPGNIQQGNFHSGFSGLMWLISHLGKEYIDLDSLTKYEFNKFCFQRAYNYLKIGNYDFLMGGIGYSITLFENEMFNEIKRLSQLLLSNSNLDDNSNLFWTSSNLYDLSSNKIQYLGLAHGSASILMFFVLKGKIDNKESEISNYEICNRIIKNILNYKDTKSLNLFPSEITNQESHQNTRLAWCHGDLGIAAAIFNAGVTFNNQEWLNEAYEILHHIHTKRTDLEQNGIYDANICHGAAGVAHIFNKIYQYSKITEFKDATDLWIGHVLSFAKHDDGIAGFKTMDNEKGLINSTGMLTGVSGIGLVLLNYLYPETVNTWDRCLLLS